MRIMKFSFGQEQTLLSHQESNQTFSSHTKPNHRLSYIGECSVIPEHNRYISTM